MLYRPWRDSWHYTFCSQHVTFKYIHGVSICSWYKQAINFIHNAFDIFCPALLYVCLYCCLSSEQQRKESSRLCFQEWPWLHQEWVRYTNNLHHQTAEATLIHVPLLLYIHAVIPPFIMHQLERRKLFKVRRPHPASLPGQPPTNWAWTGNEAI